MTTVAPMMIFKKWEGSDAERFKHTDMNRIRQNVATLGAMVSVPYTAVSVAQSDIFRFDEQNTLEQAIKDICSAVGISAPMDTDWNYNRVLTYLDFERVEKWLHDAYNALRGEGERIGWNKSRKFDMFTLYADNWTGSGPYYYNVPTTYGADYDEGLVFVRSGASVSQRYAEYSGIITVRSSASGVVLQANGLKPEEDIPIIITRGRPAMKETATLTVAGWTGSGPWYQTVVFANEVADGVVTISENTSDSGAVDFAESGISVSAVNGNQVTFRSVLKKPTYDLPILLIYETSEST